MSEVRAEITLKVDEERKWIRIERNGVTMEVGILVTPEFVSVDVWSGGGSYLHSESYVEWKDADGEE